MLTQAQIDQFDRDGFLNGGRVLSEANLKELSDELDRIIAKGPNGFAPGENKPVLFRDLTGGVKDTKDTYGSGDGKAPVWQIVNIWETSPAFERLLYHPVIVQGISQLTKMADLMIWHDQVQYKPALAGGSTTWHQDAPLWPTILPMTPVSAWIPFDDADLENGCMWMMPGSHRWGNQMKFLNNKVHLKEKTDFGQAGEGFEVPADSPIKQARAVPWPVKKGELSFHHSLTWHGSPTNKSPRPRRAIAIHYMTGDARYQGKKGHPMEQFIDLPEGAPMAEAGDHFPRVCRNGKPVEPTKLLSVSVH
jgi:phytanoyl-CoA hydroxylase